MRPTLPALLAALVMAFGLAQALVPQGVEGGAFSLHVRTDGDDDLCTGYVDASASNAPDCAFFSVEAAVNVAPTGGRVTIGPGLHVEGLVSIERNITIVGQAGSRPDVVASSGGSWFTCGSSARCAFSNLTLDGNDLNLGVGIDVLGSAVVENVILRDFRPPGNAAAAAIIASGVVEVTNSIFENVYTGVDVRFGSLSSISNSEFHDSVQAIQVLAPNVMIADNVFRSAGYGVMLRPRQADAGPSHAVLLSNTFEDMYASVFVTLSGENKSSAEAHFNRLDGLVSLRPSPAIPSDFTNNWWGCNGSGLVAPPCMGLQGDAGATYAPWLVMRMQSAGVARGPTSIKVDFNRNSAGQDISAQGTIPDGTRVAFTRAPASVGSVTPPSANTLNGIATATFTPGASDGAAIVTAQTDEQQVTRTIIVDRKGPGTTITGPKDRAVLQRLRRVGGTAADANPGSGIAKVFVAVMRKVNGKCEFLDGMIWLQRACGNRVWLPATGKARWSAALSRAAVGPDRRYWIYSRAIDVAGNAFRPPFTRGKDFIVVDVK